MISLRCKPDMVVRQFVCIQSDIDANKHLPVDGKLCNMKVENGDELYCMTNQNTWMYDLENGIWLPQ